MSGFNKVKDYEEKAKILSRNGLNKTQLILWILALLIGGGLGFLNVPILNDTFNLIATIYTHLFQLIAIPTIALAVISTLSTLGADKYTGKIFLRAIIYTLLTTIFASLVGLMFYVWFNPSNIPFNLVDQGASNVPEKLIGASYAQHLINVVPSNFLRPFIEGNVLSVMIIAVIISLGLAFMPKSDNQRTLLRGVLGLQELLFTLIRGLIYVLPLGILAFAGQLSAEIEAGIIVGALGSYVAVIMGGNLFQFFIVIPLFLLVRGLNPIKVFMKMSPAVMVALFTKSSAATLPVTMASAEENLKANPMVSRFVLPICTTLNMNGCAAFILVTSLFMMQNAGIEITTSVMITWLFISVLSAIGNAGVPMGCYFLTLSLMSSIGVPIALMGVILPVYALIDMIETAENVWSDAAVCAMTDKDLIGKIPPNAESLSSAKL